MGKRHVGPMEHRTQIRVSAATYNKLAGLRRARESWDDLIVRLLATMKQQSDRIINLANELCSVDDTPKNEGD